MCCAGFFVKRAARLGFIDGLVGVSTTFIYSFGFVKGMKIEIDTRVDSREELLLAARLLEEVAGSTPSGTSSAVDVASESSVPADAMPAAFGLFDSEDDEDDHEPVERVDARSGFGVVPYE